jgi:hypothetical protein
MSAATAAEPVPLYTRHMVGAIEAARDRRLQERNRAVHRYTSGGPSLHVVPAMDGEGGRLPSDTVPATIVARAS